MALQLTQHTDPRAFRDIVMDHLLQTEAECCLQIGLIQRLAAQGSATHSTNDLAQPLMWTIHDGSAIDLVVMQTLKAQMNITRGSTQAMQRLAQELAARKWDGTLILGTTPSIGKFAKSYSALTNRPTHVKMNLRVFELVKVQWPTPVSGAMRLCQSADRELVAEYLAGFQAGIGEPTATESKKQVLLADADRAISAKNLFFWVDQQPVAMAAVVIAGSLRNAHAVAKYAAAHGRTITVIPSGERWPDGTLRPAVEDLVAAGSIIANLPGASSPEAQVAIAAWDSAKDNINQFLTSCASGRELIEKGYAEDVKIAGEVNVSAAVPLLHEKAYCSGENA